MTMKTHKTSRYAILAGLLLTFSSYAAAATLTVAVAASARYAFDDLQAAFSARTGHVLKPVVGSSGKLSAQIMHGAPFDVFLSADMGYPEKLHAAGFSSAPKVYAYGALVLWTSHDLALDRWQQLLRSPEIRKIAVASPKTAPYGREAMNLLAHFKLDEAVKPKLVFGESISQVNQYIHSRAVDIGFTAKSVVMSPEMQGHGKWIALPQDAYQPIAQGIAVLRHGQRNQPQAAQQFHDFVLSPPARAILERYGYLLP